jgi:hypothetical protein
MPFEKQPKVENQEKPQELEEVKGTGQERVAENHDSFDNLADILEEIEKNNYKEWKEHFGVEAEISEEIEKNNYKEWKEHFGILADVQEESEANAHKGWKEHFGGRKEVSKEEKGKRTDEILKEVGVEKPAESFDEVEIRLAEKLRQAKEDAGGNLPLSEKNRITLNFYRNELGYNIKYDFFHNAAELIDENKEAVRGKNDKPLKFKTFFNANREDTPLIDFLKERVRETYEDKPVKEMSEEEEIEAGFQKAEKMAEQKQAERKEGVSSLQDAKKIGKERLTKTVEKFSDALSYLFIPDKLAALGYREGKKMAIEGGEDLAVANLTYLAAIEDVIRRIFGFIQAEGAIRKGAIGEKEKEILNKKLAEGRSEDFAEKMAEVESYIEKADEQLSKGWSKLSKKGKLSRLIEVLQGEKK